MDIVKLSTLHLNDGSFGLPKNPRFIRDDRFRALCRSVADNPEYMPARPIIVNEDGVILGGNMRLRAAIAAGVEMIPVTIVDWSEEKQRQFIIKDNVSGGEWDWEMLANEWNDAELIDWGVDLPEEEAEPEEDEPLDTEAINAIVTDIALGDVLEIGPHRLVCGDSTVDQYVDTLTDGNEIDAIFMDPPYALFGNSSGMEKVADLFVGGGSTMVAAHQINRRCFAMEIDPKYCHVTIQRMLRLDPTLEVKRNGEKYTTTGN